MSGILDNKILFVKFIGHIITLKRIDVRQNQQYSIYCPFYRTNKSFLYRTRNLLLLTGPVLDILNKGLTLVIDELDTSLHTPLVRQSVRLFHQPKINTGGLQLIFTTHDTSLLDAPNLLRRDQIWFVEKDHDQASRLVSLSDFSPRKNEPLQPGT
jgi:predicted ATP-dependent endonuclease of OLD family